MLLQPPYRPNPPLPEGDALNFFFFVYAVQACEPVAMLIDEIPTVQAVSQMKLAGNPVAASTDAACGHFTGSTADAADPGIVV